MPRERLEKRAEKERTYLEKKASCVVDARRSYGLGARLGGGCPGRTDVHHNPQYAQRIWGQWHGTVTVSGDQATVDIQSAGLAAGAPHAQHIHIGGQGVCPPASADTDGTGTISTAEGQPFYGAVQVSLTTTGDVSAESALAVDRFPVANADGTLNYSRTFTLPAGVTAADLEGGSIVQHGIDFNGNGTYDMSAGVSSLDPSLPFEATVPAVCGELAAMTVMPDTGGPALPMTTAAVALLGVGVLGLVAFRRLIS